MAGATQKLWAMWTKVAVVSPRPSACAALIGACFGVLAACGAGEPRTYADPAEPYRRTLEDLIVFQEAYIREHGEPDSPPFRGFRPAERYVALATSSTEAGGWGAVAFDPRDPMWSCVYKTEFVSALVATLGLCIAKYLTRAGAPTIYPP